MQREQGISKDGRQARMGPVRVARVVSRAPAHLAQLLLLVLGKRREAEQRAIRHLCQAFVEKADEGDSKGAIGMHCEFGEGAGPGDTPPMRRDDRKGIARCDYPTGPRAVCEEVKFDTSIPALAAERPFWSNLARMP